MLRTLRRLTNRMIEKLVPQRPQPTIVRRKTARNLSYLVRKGHTPAFKGRYIIPANLRHRMAGRIVCPNVPTHGV